MLLFFFPLDASQNTNVDISFIPLIFIYLRPAAAEELHFSTIQLKHHLEEYLHSF